MGRPRGLVDGPVNTGEMRVSPTPSGDVPIFSARLEEASAAGDNTPEKHRGFDPAYLSGAAPIALAFADALCRERKLTDEETDLIIKLNQYLILPSRLRRWTADEDAELLRHVGRMSAGEIGRTCDRSPWAVRSRIRNLRAQGKLPKIA